MSRFHDLDRLPNAPFDALQKEQPDPQQVTNIASRIRHSMAPVRPLPSRARIITLLLLAFALFSILVAMPFGLLGYNDLSIALRIAYGLPIVLLAAALASSLDAQLIPGSRQLLAPSPLVLLTIALLGALAIMYFPHVDMDRFVVRGLPCLKLGTICAAVSGLLLALWIRRGYSVSTIRTGAIAGAFAGLTGFAVLALHCPQQNALHILVWHLGAVVIAAIAGTLLGILSSR